MRLFPRLALICAAVSMTTLGGCAGMMSALGGAPPAAVGKVARLTRGPIDFALHSFDAGLYAFDLAMDLGKPKPGSPEAKRIAAAGRKVLAALAVADAAQKAGAADTYEEAFTNANTALEQFRSLLGVTPTDTASLQLPAIAPRDREVILTVAERGNPNG